HLQRLDVPDQASWRSDLGPRHHQRCAVRLRRLYAQVGVLALMQVVNEALDASRTRVVLFDFDGTLSLIRSGWMDVMVAMMVEILAACNSGESEHELRAVVEDYVWRLTGQETVYQMIELAAQIRKRGGSPVDPLVYKHQYLDRLWTRIRDRVHALRQCAA